MNVFFASLGCDKNLVDSEKMLGLLDANNYTIIDDENDMQPEQQGHFVQTNPQFGITLKDAERVITILKHFLISK